jgi:hypothetical protein
MSFKVAAPATPGRYRLTVTLHDADGVAYDALTQAKFPALIIRVTGEVDAQIVAPSRAELEPGSASTLDLWVANLGKAAWGHGALQDPENPGSTVPATSARVSGQWVALGIAPEDIASAAAAGTVSGSLPAGQEPGAVVDTALDLIAPTVAGEYLLLLDIVTPDHGSIVAAGVEPTIIRVSVKEGAAAPAAPAAAPAASTAPAASPAPAAVAAE